MITFFARPLDTSREADEIQLSIFRNMSEGERQRRAAELIRSCRQLHEQGVHSRHPHYNKDEVRIAAIRMRLGEELFRKVYSDFLYLTP